MADIVSSLFGLSPMDTQQQIEQEDMRNALAIANLPQGKRAAYTGQLIGTKLARGLLSGFGIQDPRLQKATTLEEALKEVNDSLTDEEKANPYALYTRLADTLAAKGLQQESAMARAKAQESGLAYQTKLSEVTKNIAQAEQARRGKLSPFRQLQMDYADAVASGQTDVAAELKRKIELEASRTPPTPENQAEATVLAKFKKDFGQEEGSKKFLEWQTEQKASVVAAGKPVEYGGAKPSDISTFETSVRNTLKPFKDVLGKVGEAKLNLQQVFAGNAQAVPLLDSAIMSLSKDNTISKADIDRISKTGGFGQRVVDSFTKFITGKPSEVNLQDKKQLLDALEVAYAEKHNKEQDRLRKSWSGSVLSTQQIDATLGSPYRLPGSSAGTPGQKKKTSSGVEYTIEAN